MLAFMSGRQSYGEMHCYRIVASVGKPVGPKQATMDTRGTRYDDIHINLQNVTTMYVSKIQQMDNYC